MQPQHIPSTGTPTPAVGAPHSVAVGSQIIFPGFKNWYRLQAEPTPTFEIEIDDNPYQPPNLLGSHDASRGLNPQQAKDSQPKKKPSLLRRVIKKLKKWPRTIFWHKISNLPYMSIQWRSKIWETWMPWYQPDALHDGGTFKYTFRDWSIDEFIIQIVTWLIMVMMKSCRLDACRLLWLKAIGSLPNTEIQTEDNWNDKRKIISVQFLI